MHNILPASFGYHSCSTTSESVLSITNKIRDFLDVVHKITLAISGAFALLGLMSCSAAIGIGIGASTLYYGFKVYSYLKICQAAGLIINRHNIPHIKISPRLTSCEALPTVHGAETELWRKRLVAAAQKNIVVSGNYCGGKSFVEFLHLIEGRIREVPDLKVVILSSPNFLQGNSAKKVNFLLKTYPGNFSLIETPDIIYISPGLKKSTNHTKCMVIDYGKYFILGGSGIKDNFTKTGLDDLPKKKFLNSEALGSGEKAEAEDSGYGLFDNFVSTIIPGNFRDMDFVFHSTNGKNPSGEQIYKQMLLLAHRWERYNQTIESDFWGRPSEPLDIQSLGMFTKKAAPIDSSDSITTQLLKSPIPKRKLISTSVLEFDSSAKKTANVAINLFATGPEQSDSPFARAIVERIQRARDRITINHMYFQPTSEIMDALIEAANRGIKIRIITSNIYENCPNSHYIFGARNQYNYNYLVENVSEEKKENIEIFEFRQNKKGNHKKVIVIDDYVIAGSSNLGYKSLVSTSDHELNFIARSKGFVKETLNICEIDILHSKKIDAPNALSLSQKIKVVLHRFLAPLIG